MISSAIAGLTVTAKTVVKISRLLSVIGHATGLIGMAAKEAKK